MKIIINIVVTLILMPWPILLMMSPMMFDAPGSENNKSHVASMMLILCYPIGLFVLLWIFGANYFGFSGLSLALTSIVVIAIVFSMFGYFGMLFNLQKGISNRGYSVADNHVYFDGKLIEGADSESFSRLVDEDSWRSTEDYAFDRRYLYCEGKIVEGAMTDNLRKVLINRDTYLLNAMQVIYGGRILPGANPDDFDGYEGFTGWAYSVNNSQYMVYSYGDPLPAVDKATFTPLNSFIAKDKHHVFEKHNYILPDADALTFELLEDHDFGRDKNYIYYLATRHPFAIKDIDPESFERLERGYLKDKNNVFHVIQYERIEKLEKADAASFEATNYDDKTKSEARDKNHYYYDGKVVGVR